MPLSYQGKDISIIYVLSKDNDITYAAFALIHSNGIEDTDACGVF